MRIGVFFDGYMPLHETKDPGQLVLGFLDLGIQSEMITLYKPELSTYRAPFPIRFVNQAQMYSIDYWRKVPDDVIIAYTWLSKKYLPLIYAIKKAGKFVIAKADSDGRYVFPTTPRCLPLPKLQKFFDVLGAKESFRRACYTLLAILISQHRIKQIAEHIKLVDKVIIESPQAQVNLSYSLLYWGFELPSKIHVIPNPVASDIISANVPSKEKQIVAVARWEAVDQKNTITMSRVLCHFAKLRPDYKIVIIGSGKEIIQRFISKWASQLPNIHLTGKIPREELIRHLAKSQIFFMPSNAESFGIAAAEAVCMGCTIVGTPIESLTFLTWGGFSGTIATGFTELPLLTALLIDAHKWELGYYDPQNISHFWRNNLCRKAIAEKIVRLINVSENVED
jgi:glycosyltransferase involved in cell wall biosynthesis